MRPRSQRQERPSRRRRGCSISTWQTATGSSDHHLRSPTLPSAPIFFTRRRPSSRSPAMRTSAAGSRGSPRCPAGRRLRRQRGRPSRPERPEQRAAPSRAALLAPIANPAVRRYAGFFKTHEYARLRLAAGLGANRETVSMSSLGWTNDVLKFWFDKAGSDRWFGKDATFDDTVRRRFRAVHEALSTCDNDLLLVDPRTALAAVIVLDQMSRNMFRDPPDAFAADRRALSIAQEAIAGGFDVGLSKDERMFLYLPFEHAEDADAQARCVTLMATLDDPELVKWAEAHRSIIVPFVRFPRRNPVLGRTSTPQATELLQQPDSTF